MKKRQLIFVVLSVGALLSTFSCQKSGASTDNPGSSRGDTTDNAPPPVKTLDYIYKAGTEGYSCFRIPAIIKTKKGTLLAFAEARKNDCGDAGNIDLVVRRSLDSGKTWSGLITVWDDGSNTCGNPAPVIDEKTGNVILLMSWNLGKDDIGEIDNGTSEDTRRVYVTHSADDGLSWEVPKEITDSVKLKNWGWYATGPCHGIQIAGSKHAGRLVIPCDHIALVTKKGSSHVIYSDDDGSTWHLGGIVPGGGNESSVAELFNGDLMINMRSSGHRLISTSTDGGISWSTAKADSHLPDPACQGSLLSYSSGLSHGLFFANPSNGSVRADMTIKGSLDDGVTWPKSLLVYEGPSAYSDLTMIDATHVGILYEAGKSSPYEGIVFESVSVSEIK